MSDRRASSRILLAVVVAALRIGTVISSAGNAYSQVSVPTIIKIPQVVVIKVPPLVDVKAPPGRAVDPKPHIDTASPTPTTLRIQPTPRIDFAPTVAPGPHHPHHHADCTVRNFFCARSCDPLPEQWSSYRTCVAYHCRQVEENCLDKLAEELETKTRSDDQVTFEIKVEYPYEVQVEFYSQDRNVAWPGGDEAYVVADYDTHEYTLQCNSGEKICYGGWPADGSTYWGSGTDDRHGCRHCCAICDGRSVSYVLK